MLKEIFVAARKVHSCKFCSSLVYVMLSCTFRYGRQDMDVMGVAFRRDLFVVTRQVYPEMQDKEKLTHTKIQQKLLRKLGDNAFPFFFEVSERAARTPIQSVASFLGPTTSNPKNKIIFSFWCFSSQTTCRAQWLCSLRPMTLGRYGLRPILQMPGCCLADVKLSVLVVNG